MNQEVTMQLTRDERCPNCHVRVWRIEPEIDSWRYYCAGCERLTLTASQVARLGPPEAGSIGYLVSVSVRIQMESDPRPYDQDDDQRKDT
jgi:DNA-directed RNA polymerase subunit RPC12/RpoP